MEGVDDFIRSPNCHAGRRGRNVVALVFHDEEYPERHGSARTVAGMFSNPSFGASTTCAIDAGQIIGCVDYDDTPWHTGAGFPHNEATDGAEHDGYAHQSRAEWLDAYGIDLLERSAGWFAWRCHVRGIPPRLLDAEGYRRAIARNDPTQGGIVGHNTITQAQGVYGGHTDPGSSFPWDHFIGRVQAHYGGSPGVYPVPSSELVVYRRNAEARMLVGTVVDLQALLIAVSRSVSNPAMDPGPADGLFGPQTEAAVLEFQRHGLDLDGQPLDVDGIVGPETWASLHFCAYIAGAGQGFAVQPHSDAVPPLPYLLHTGLIGDGYVRQWQQRMSDRGWAIDVDGVYGPQSAMLCEAFQREKGLLADGVVGPETWAAAWLSPIT